MNLLLGFAPFAAFALLHSHAGLTLALATASLLAVGIVAVDVLQRRAPEPIELGSVILFGGLAAHAAWAGPVWGVYQVRLIVDVGLLLLVLASIAVGRPFTLAYARGRVSSDDALRSEFLAAHFAITRAWAVALGVVVIADVCMVWLPQVPVRLDVLVTVLALVAAAKYTRRRAAGVSATERAA